MLDSAHIILHSDLGTKRQWQNAIAKNPKI